MTLVTPILDREAIEKVTELRARLTRGGLSPEAVQKAVEAFRAGDIHALHFAAIDDALVVPIPEELLVRVFPQLRDRKLDRTAPGFPDGGHVWMNFLEPGAILEYEINRHRGDRKSLTIRWPGAKENEEPEFQNVSGAQASLLADTGKEKVAADAAEPDDPFDDSDD